LKSKSYLILPSWKLNIQVDTDHFETNDSVQFFVEHNQAYVRKFVKLAYAPKDASHSYRMIDEPVRFRYNFKNQCVMIPVSKMTAHITGTILVVIALIFFLYLILLTSYFLWFLFDVSKGNIFTDLNMIRLKTIAYSLLAIPFISLIFNLLIRLIFIPYLTTDVVLKIDTLNNYWKELALGVVFLIVYLSFSQGKKLKDEQALTI
ncbi:MAG TPA: DUF2975 domain-containing protein, partial [Mucilaginibacter sp.]|nr:DUF2975 domain-containing protein [Mucilaginibacter sp.]